MRFGFGRHGVVKERVEGGEGWRTSEEGRRARAQEEGDGVSKIVPVSFRGRPGKEK